MWRELGINSWPTFAVVSPNGKVIAQIAGESHRKVTFFLSLYMNQMCFAPKYSFVSSMMLYS